MKTEPDFRADEAPVQFKHAAASALLQIAFNMPTAEDTAACLSMMAEGGYLTADEYAQVAA